MKKLSVADEKKLQKLREALETAAVEYNQALAELHNFRDELHDRMQDYFDSKSESWQASDAGQAYETFMQAYEDDAGEEAEEIIPEYPTEPE